MHRVNAMSVASGIKEAFKIKEIPLGCQGQPLPGSLGRKKRDSNLSRDDAVRAASLVVAPRVGVLGLLSPQGDGPWTGGWRPGR